MTMTTATIGRDKNGNKTVHIEHAGKRGFSVRTNGNLPLCHKIPMFGRFDSHTLTDEWEEIRDYVFDNGTDRQNDFFGIKTQSNKGE